MNRGREVQAARNGVLVIDVRGDVLYAGGTGKNAIVQEKLLDLWKSGQGKPVSSMTAIKGMDSPLTVVSYVSPEVSCFVLFALEQSDPLFEFVNSVDFAADILRHFITNPYEAITVVDKQALIRYMSPTHEKFFGIPRGGAWGEDVNKIIENSRLTDVLRSGKTQVGHVHKMRGVSLVVSRTPINDSEGRLKGAIGQVMFKSPAELEALSEEVRRLRQEIRFYERQLPKLRGNDIQGMDAIVGESSAIRKLKEQIRKVAPLDVSVLLVGESGVGKDLVAHAIHELSSRTNKIVLVNAAAIPGNLVEAELFGYESGAFTGAEKGGRSGKFEQAHDSSLFLDEIGDMPLDIQVKVLRTLQDGTFQRVGGSNQRRSNFRLISASNRNFQEMVESGEFRLDLFYRISAVTIRIPPLRERLEDVPLLAQTFLERFMKRHNMQDKHFGPGVIEYLQSLPWPGNVRQLQHTIERAAIFSEHDEITCGDCEVPLETSFARNIPDLRTAYQVADQPAFGTPGSTDVHEAKARVELEMIREALTRFDGNKKKTAEFLGISRSYLYKRLAELDTSTH